MPENNNLETRERMTRTIMPKEYFTYSGGMVIKSLLELPDAIERAGSQGFFFHVTDYKNDFAKWIYDVYGLSDLSLLLGPIKSKEETIRVIRAYISACMESAKAEEKISIASENGTGKFESLSGLKSPLSSDITSERSVSKKIVDLISKLEEKVDLRIKKGTPLPPSEIPALRPAAITPDSQNERKFILPQVRKNEPEPEEEKDHFGEKVKKIEDRLKTEIMEMENNVQEKDVAQVTVVMNDFQANSLQLPKVSRPIAEAKAELDIDSIPKYVPKAEPVKVEEQKPVIAKQINLEVKGSEFDKIDEPNLYFEKNPVTINQAIDARKKSLQIEKLEAVKYTGKEIPKELIENFRDSYAKTYQKLVEKRKAGFDTSIAEIMVMRIPAKLKIYEASTEERDSIPVKRYLNEAIEELNNLL